MRISIGGNNFKDAIVQLENRNVERPAPKIVNGNNPVLALVESISKRSRSWFVDQSKNVKPGNTSRIFGSLALGVIEVCGYRDDGLRNRPAEEAFSISFKLAQDERGNFRRRICTLADLDAEDFAGLKSSARRKGNSFSSS